MLNDQIIKKYFRYFAVFMIFTVVVLSFLWINHLYSENAIAKEEYRNEVITKLNNKVNLKSRLVLNEADRIYDQELNELKNSMYTYFNVLRSTMLDYYFVLKYDLNTMKNKIDSLLEDFYETNKINVYLKSVDGTWEAGKQLLEIPDLESNTSTIVGDKLVYRGSVLYPNVEVYLYLDYKDRVKTEMRKNLIKYLELDPSIIAYDDRGVSLNGLSERLTSSTSSESNNDFISIEKSEKSGFHFGYTIPIKELNDTLNFRDYIFQNFMKNHILEMIGFLLIFFISSVFLYTQIKRNYNKQYDRISRDLISAYSNADNLDDYSAFDDFFLKSTLKDIITDVEQKDLENKRIISNMDSMYKKLKIQNLVLSRKIKHMSKDYMYTDVDEIPDCESIDTSELIISMHNKYSPDSNLVLNDKDVTIISNLEILSDILENIFKMGTGGVCEYKIDIIKDDDMVSFSFNIEGCNQLNLDSLDIVKKKVKKLSGIFIRGNLKNKNLSIIFSIKG